MTDFDSITGRMMEAGRFKNYSALARALDVTPQALSNYRKRGVFPAGLAVEFALLNSISLDWLFTGVGGVQAPEPVPAIKDLTPDELILTGKLLKVLRSGDPEIISSVTAALGGYVDFVAAAGMRKALSA